MGASADHYRSSFARSLSSIHLQRAEDCNAINVDTNTITLKKRVRGGKQSPICSSTVIPPFSGCSNEPPALPFSKDGQPSRTLVGKFQRRSTVAVASSRTSGGSQEFDCSTKTRRRRRATVTFAPALEQPPSTSSGGENDTEFAGFRKDYSIGEELRSSCHMIVNPISEQATQAVNSLQMHDFAFVKRSDGTYSYAILACRIVDPIKGEYMIFVMDDVGSTKMIGQKHWSESIRLVSME